MKNNDNENEPINETEKQPALCNNALFNLSELPVGRRIICACGGEFESGVQLYPVDENKIREGLRETIELLYSLRAKTLKYAKLIFEWISRCFLQGDASIVQKKRWERRQKATSRFKVFNRNEYKTKRAKIKL